MQNPTPPQHLYDKDGQLYGIVYGDDDPPTNRIETDYYDEGFCIIATYPSEPSGLRERIRRWFTKQTVEIAVAQTEMDGELDEEWCNELAVALSQRLGLGVVSRVECSEGPGDPWVIVLHLGAKQYNKDVQQAIYSETECILDIYNADQLGGWGDDLVHGPEDH